MGISPHIFLPFPSRHGSALLLNGPAQAQSPPSIIRTLVFKSFLPSRARTDPEDPSPTLRKKNNHQNEKHSLGGARARE